MDLLGLEVALGTSAWEGFLIEDTEHDVAGEQ